MRNTSKYENHFKLEIMIDEYIENFNKDKLKIEFVEINLEDESTGNKVNISDRPCTILYNNLSGSINFNLYILNNSIRKSERIDYLLDDGYEIKNIILDIYYDDRTIDEYMYNESIGEQVDLIKILNKSKIFEITKMPIIVRSPVPLECSFLMIPRNDDNKLVLKKKVIYNEEDTQGVKYFDNGAVIKVDGYTILDKFKKVDLYLISKTAPIVPKDLESLSINIGNTINIDFQDKGEKWTTIHSISNTGTINRTYCTPCFNLGNVKCIKIGFLYKQNDKIFVSTDVGLYKSNFLDLN